MRIANILVPTDFGESSEQAVRLAVQVAARFNATLTLLHSFEVPAYVYAGLGATTADYLVPIEDAARRSLEDALRAVQAESPSAQALLKQGAAWQGILDATKEIGADLVVMGTHGRQGISRALIGSVAEKVVRLSSVPVLTVRGKPSAK